MVAGEEEKAIIRSAFNQWQEMTCVRFFEVNTQAKISQAHLLITKERSGSVHVEGDGRWRCGQGMAHSAYEIMYP